MDGPWSAGIRVWRFEYSHQPEYEPTLLGADQRCLRKTAVARSPRRSYVLLSDQEKPDRNREHCRFSFRLHADHNAAGQQREPAANYKRSYRPTAHALQPRPGQTDGFQLCGNKYSKAGSRLFGRVEVE